MSIRIIKEVDELPNGARVFIYGTGIAGKAFLFYLSKMRPDAKVLGFIDTYKSGKCCGHKIYKFENFIKKFKKDDFDLILIASMYYEAIGKLLSENGVENYALVKGKNPAYSIFIEDKDYKDYLKKISDFLLKALFLLFRKKNIIVVGEYGGNFVGNSKYFYLYLKERGVENVYWLVNNKDYYNKLKKENIKTFFYGGNSYLFKLLTTSFVIFDNRDWWREYPLLLKLPLKKIQLWHGVGFKYIELSLLSDKFLKSLNMKEKKLLKKRYPSYDLLVTTSDFYAEKVFGPAFDISLERVKPLGYPRNDIFYRDIPGEEINTDKEVMEFARKFKKSAGKILVFAPTFRDLSINVDFRSVFDYKKLDEFLKKKNILFIVKGHSLPGIDYFLENIDNYENILIYDNKKDVYPLLKITDLLITDYSSIYTDFLHTKRPVLFYPFDYEEYTDLHRQLQFDYNEMTPGPKAKNFGELLNWVNHFLVEGKDGFESDRERILNLAFKYKDGNSSKRIFEEMMELM